MHRADLQRVLTTHSLHSYYFTPSTLLRTQSGQWRPRLSPCWIPQSISGPSTKLLENWHETLRNCTHPEETPLTSGGTHSALNAVMSKAGATRYSGPPCMFPDCRRPKTHPTKKGWAKEKEEKDKENRDKEKAKTHKEKKAKKKRPSIVIPPWIRLRAVRIRHGAHAKEASPCEDPEDPE